MARHARVKSKTGIYHIMLRGINKQDIFEDDEDRQKFIETLKFYKEKIGYTLFGYCLMSNHVHLLLKEGNESFSITLKRISSSYVFWYNNKYERCGHLFQERYKSEVIENEEYLITALRYIHQNPVNAGIVKEISEYKWSSYNLYIKNVGIVDIEFILESFSKDRKNAIIFYDKFMREQKQDNFIEYKEKVRICDSELLKFINENYSLTVGALYLLERQQINIIIHRLKEIESVTIRQIVRVTGVSKYLVEKA